MVYEHDPLIAEYTHERQRPRADEALHTLRRVATMVKPLMRTRGWTVRTLAEFYPAQASLLGLNWNRGAKICLRLRHAGDERQFLRFEDVVDTMLHELAHIVHGPHDQAFHALWDALRDEYEALLRKGYSGEGFLSKGRRLGGRETVEELRRQQRADALQRRQAAQAGRGGAGRRLGGRPVRRDEDIRQVIADAAERRKQITQGCASGRGTESERRAIVEEASRNGFSTKAEEDEANERAIMDAVIDLIQQEERERLGDAYVPPTPDNPAGSRGTTLPAAGTNPGALLPPRPPPPPPPPVPLATKPSPASSASAASDAGWSCPLCTLHNHANHLCCDACGSERPSSLSAADYRDDTSSMLTSPFTSAAATRRSASDDSRSAKKVIRTSDANVLKPRSSQQAIAKIYEMEAAKQAMQPIGWSCPSCGTFMETQWWTCTICGRMKASS